jgi:hypothetical protein
MPPLVFDSRTWRTPPAQRTPKNRSSGRAAGERAVGEAGAGAGAERRAGVVEGLEGHGRPRAAIGPHQADVGW